MIAGVELLAQFLHDHVALARVQVEADRLIAASLAGHLVHELPGPDGSATVRDPPWRLDPVPVVLDGATFADLADGVAERLRGMEALLTDLYGSRRSVREGWVPAEALASSSRYRLSAVGVPPPPRWLTTYAVDVIGLADGTWRVVQDLADTPTGVGYAIIDRAAMARVAAELLGPRGAGDLASISGFPAEVRHRLAALSTAPSPRVVLLTAGIDDPAYVEHSSLARLFGFHLVEAPDLVVRRGRLWLRALGRLDPVDVVYRRLADVAVDPIEVSTRSTTGVPGLLLAATEGGVVLANAHGAGVIEDPALASWWPGAVEGLTGSALRLRPLAAADRPAELPAFRDGRATTARVVVRLHAVAGPDGVTVMAGGNGRVLSDGDDARRPTARVAKDVWVIGAPRHAPGAVAPLPQVDLTASVPTRVAVAMFWLGRAAERAEAVARTARVIFSRRQTDPSLTTADGGRWATRMVHVLRAVRNAPGELASGTPVSVLDAELADATRAVSERLAAVLAAAATVGEYLSITAGRVLADIASARHGFADGHAPIDAIDACIADLAAFVGLWDESTVRGPAWRFGDLGRRIERALVVLGLFGACLAGDGDDDSALEVLLAANESLVAYRRRHRSDIEVGAATALLLHNVDNPRSFLASVERMAEHVAAIDWPEGRDAVARLAGIIDDDDEVMAGVGEATAAVTAFATMVDETWFATPVNPMVVHGRLQ